MSINDSKPTVAPSHATPFVRFASVAEFWAYSVARYQQPGLQQALLTLQNDDGANVNGLLALCYLAEQQAQFSAAASEIQSAWQALHNFSQQYTVPFRQRRLALKTTEPERYQLQRSSLLAQELALEQQEQLLIVNGLAPLTWCKADFPNAEQFCEWLTPLLLRTAAITRKRRIYDLHQTLTDCRLTHPNSLI